MEPLPGKVEHLWCSLYPDIHGNLGLDTLIAFANDGRGARVVAKIEGETAAASGTPDEMLAAFDDHVLGTLAAGNMIVARQLDSDMRDYCLSFNLHTVNTQPCAHLHRPQPLSLAVGEAQADKLLRHRDVVALRAPTVGMRLLLSGSRLSSSVNAMFWTDQPTESTEIVIAEARFAHRVPVDFLIDLVHTGASQYRAIDILGFDATDVRTRPFGERRALLAELVAEMDSPHLQLLDEMSRAERRGPVSGGVLFAEVDAPWRSFWSVVA